MPDAQPTDAGSLSTRAQEILRRADAQLAALRPPEAEPAPPEEGEGEAPPPDRPPVVRDLGELLDTVEAGVGASRAHLVALSASLERVSEEIQRVIEEHRLELPPQLAEHARLPDARPAKPPEPDEEAEVETEPPPEAEAVPPAAGTGSGAAHDAARLVAIEMAVAGDSREIVGRRLREEFGIRDPGPLLDHAFGPDTSGGRRSYRG